eukprot:TRINITY_DN23578_c0_g1_i1.p1 TRINITY_DN23578_c0_g1~~TRINITY_DN23578_c0_g1_i1.p1  ORF type:complete len:117 (+),score=33.29 TRINITY_DN23578_c0_g1_i1:62-412(+)
MSATLTRNQERAMMSKEKATAKRERGLVREAERIEKSIIKTEEKLERVLEKIELDISKGKKGSKIERATAKKEVFEKKLERKIAQKEIVERELDEMVQTSSTIRTPRKRESHKNSP